MIGVGITDLAEGKVRARVGELLQARQRLQKLSRVLDPAIRREAATLLGDQKQLEKDLNPAVEATENPLQLTKLFTIASFGSQMERHLRAVANLEAKAEGLPRASAPFWQRVDPLTALKLVGLVILARKILR